MQIMVTGFLGKTKARTFMGELWTLLLESQASVYGIPQELIDLKKAELAQQAVCVLSLPTRSLPSAFSLFLSLAARLATQTKQTLVQFNQTTNVIWCVCVCVRLLACD